MIEAREGRHSVVYRDEFAYCAHPHVGVTSDGTWLLVFNKAPRHEFVLHPPEEPLFRNVIIRSHDQGSSWSAPQVVPSYEFSGTECAGLTVMSNGTVLLNQWRFDWYPIDLARGFADQSRLAYPSQFMKGWMTSPEHDVSGLSSVPPDELAPWVRGSGQTFIHLSNDNGLSFPVSMQIDTSPFSGGYGMRSAVELTDGTLLLLLSDIPNYRKIFAIRGQDYGRHWSKPIAVAAGETHEFEEPAAIVCESGKIIAVLRDNVSRHLHQVESVDGGSSWSKPRMLDITGYPAHLLRLSDGRLLMTYGWRQPDFGIRAVLSADDGKTWDTKAVIRIRGGMRNKNLGYPVTIPTGTDLITFYYGEDETGCTSIMATSWRL
jgi:hypothetical protein